MWSYLVSSASCLVVVPLSLVLTPVWPQNFQNGFDLCGLCNPEASDSRRPGLGEGSIRPQEEVTLTKSSSRESLGEDKAPRRTSMLERANSFATKAVRVLCSVWLQRLVTAVCAAHRI